MPQPLAQPEHAGDKPPRLSSDAARNELGLAMLRRLAQAEPVTLDALASDTGWPVDEIRAELQRHGDIEYDENGRIVGNGITPHRFEVDGRRMFTWCALDTVVFPSLLGVSARVESPCHATGQPIRVDVEPDRVRSVEPATAVASIVPVVDAQEQGGELIESLPAVVSRGA